MQGLYVVDELHEAIYFGKGNNVLDGQNVKCRFSFAHVLVIVEVFYVKTTVCDLFSLCTSLNEKQIWRPIGGLKNIFAGWIYLYVCCFYKFYVMVRQWHICVSYCRMYLRYVDFSYKKMPKARYLRYVIFFF